MKKDKFEKKKFFSMTFFMENGMGNPYRLDNFFPLLFLKFIPYKIKQLREVKL